MLFEKIFQKNPDEIKILPNLFTFTDPEIIPDNISYKTFKSINAHIMAHKSQPVSLGWEKKTSLN